MTHPLRSVITGGPGAGKSTLLAEMALSGMATFPEVARVILQRPGGMAMRADHPAEFAAAMLDAELAAWHQAPVGPSLYDRGFPDIVGFLELEGLAVSATLDAICREYRYNGPIFRAPPWKAIYSPDEERIQNWEQAVASDKAVISAWRHYGYQPMDLPFAPVSQRAEFVRRHLFEGEKA